MAVNKKLVIGIGAAVVAAIGIFVAITKPWKKKEEEEVEEKTETKEVTHETSDKTSPGPKLTIKKNLPKLPGFSTPKPNLSTSTTTPAKPAATTASGKKVYVYAKSDGVKVYKKSTKKGVNLGPLYNTYKKGQIIGSFVGTTSIGGAKWVNVKDGSTPVIVNQNLTYTNTF